MTSCSIITEPLSSHSLVPSSLPSCVPHPSVNKSLKLLDLGSTGMGVQGIIGLASALGEESGHCGLESLDLENPVLPVPQEATVQHLSRMLAGNTSLRELGLAKHALTDDTFETLVQYGLLRNNSITSLNLRGNRLSAFAGGLWVQRLWATGEQRLCRWATGVQRVCRWLMGVQVGLRCGRCAAAKSEGMRVTP